MASISSSAATPFNFSLLMLLIIFAFSRPSAAAAAAAAAAMEGGAAALVHQLEVDQEGHNEHVKLHGTAKKETWQRKTWMNHGSFRSPRKHLDSPTLQFPFQAREFPV
ncbi:hypothetical protein ACFX2I_037373 [Malus domestica]|uniref:Uncharacterized protein n=1 Tax=Malus domestica TaxID=3750 RepID=A0A498JMI8_MALDO|nr:hypothetical protein DVH24_035626 [Malus domestica]